MDRKLFKVLFSKPIAFHRIFAEITGNVITGVFLSQLFYWHDKGKDPEGWIYKTYGEWEAETALSRKNLNTARAKLKDMGLLEEKLTGYPPVIHYRLDVDALFDLIENYVKNDETIETSQLARNGLSNWPETGHPIGPKRAKQSYTENTSEITSSSEDGQERDFEAIALAEKAAYLAKQKLGEEIVRKRQRNFYQDAIWGVLAKKTGKDPKSVFEAFKTQVEAYAKRNGKDDPVKWAEAVIHNLFEVEGSEANNSLWQEFEAIALGKITPLEKETGRKDLSASPPAAPEPSQAARERLKQLRGGVG